MTHPATGDPVEPARDIGFTTTHWSVVLAARDEDLPEAQAALETLCCSYWYPLYAFVRRQGHSPHDAQDLTQAFFMSLLGRDFLRNVGPEKGRFRSFLLACLKRFLADEWRKAQASKRGAGRPVLALDELLAERRYQQEPADLADPEALFERRWALTLLDRVLNRLAEEFQAAGKGDTFDRLQPFLVGEKAGETYGEVASALKTTEGSVKMMVLRMRDRYRALFRGEIAQTVARPADVDEEIRHVASILRR
jgi:RNA polymerase sigma factor (sigma-70 family)